MRKFLVFLSAMFFIVPVFACANNEIDVDGTCVESKFELTTTNLTVNDDFKFNLSASGTFYVDCGNGGTLGSDNNDVSGKIISRIDTDEILYTCTYTSGGVKTIKFSGTVTKYYTGNDRGTIDFYTNATPHKIASLDGSLSALFPQLEWSGAGTPSFRDTFKNASNLTSIPDGLFANFRIYKNNTFFATFRGCSSLTGIPDNLFVNVTDNWAPWCYANMFAECSSLTYIPNGLFANRNVGLLAFYQTFSDCTSLTTIPKDLFANIDVGGYGAFQMTFSRDISLNAIPDGLFDSITTSYNSLFNSTFKGCSSLSYIPSNLFANITTAAEGMFQNTFFGCSALSGPVPASLFSGLIANGSPYATNMMTETFYGTGFDTTCPVGTTQFVTDYEDYWSGRVSCVDYSDQVCSAGEYLPRYFDSCVECPTNSICSGGTYSFNETTDQGIQSCASGTFSPSGSAVCYPHILHVGDSNVYLKSTKQTTPSLNFRIGNDIFYANMTTTRTKMNKDSEHYFHAQWENNHYYVCDDTTCPNVQ